MIRTAIAGLGRWGRELVEAAAGHPRLKIVRAAEPDMNGARDFCAKHDLDLTADLDAVLEDDPRSDDDRTLAEPHAVPLASRPKSCADARTPSAPSPPVTSTRPSSRRVAVWNARASVSEGPVLHEFVCGLKISLEGR